MDPLTPPPVSAAAGATPTLEELEADLAAVESAMSSLDRIAASGSPGEARAAEIAAVVSPSRFPLSAEERQVTADR